MRSLSLGIGILLVVALSGCAGSAHARRSEGARRGVVEPERSTSVGKASYYGGRFHGRRTASGSRFDQEAMTAAHPTLPFGTRLRVTNLSNRRSVLVRVTDRGPFVRGRIIDLSRGAARQLGFLRKGITLVRIEPMTH